jgi:hypothetical protein
MLTRPPTRVSLEPLDLEALDRAIQKRNLESSSVAAPIRAAQNVHAEQSSLMSRDGVSPGDAALSSTSTKRGSLTTRQRIGLD